ncbi:MAG: hypothetical protein WCK31_04405, partial [bacterium]
IKGLFLLFVFLLLLSYFRIVDISLSTAVIPAYLLSLLGILWIILTIKKKTHKLGIAEILLSISLIVFLISRLASSGTKNSVSGIFEILSFTSILAIILALLFFLQNYSSKIVKASLVLVYSFVTLKVVLDMFFVIQALIVALQSSSKKMGSINGLNFEVYVVAIGLFYLLLKMKMKIYFKILSYALLISSLFLLSTSMSTIASYWVIALLSVILLIVELVINFKKIIEFFKATINSLKQKKYVSFGINFLIITAVFALTIVGLFLLFRQLRPAYLGSEFSSLWLNFTKADVFKNIFRSSVDFGSVTTNTLMKHIGLNFGILPLLTLLSMVVVMLVKVIKTLPKHSEVYLYFILLGLIHSILMPISLLPLLSLGFVYIAIKELNPVEKTLPKPVVKNQTVKENVVMNEQNNQKNNKVVHSGKKRK